MYPMGHSVWESTNYTLFGFTEQSHFPQRAGRSLVRLWPGHDISQLTEGLPEALVQFNRITLPKP